MTTIEPPGNLTDLDENGRQEWSDLISGFIDQDVANFNVTQFFNPTRKATAADAVTKKIDWVAFPKQVTIASGGSDFLRWQRADRNRLSLQDEYCEWHVERNEQGKVTKVEFTSEGPEYWEFLASKSPETLVNLYRDLVDPAVQLTDLMDGNGDYIRSNRWNDPRRGGKLAHLAQGENTLGAFVNIGARSTIIRKRPDGTIMTGETELIDCGGYGERNRHSDPHIGAEVNALARMDAEITMANPVGLSMDGLFPLGWDTPDGSDPLDYWTVVRGTQEHQLRTKYEVPAEKNFVVGDILVNGEPIEFGGQIADFIRVKLVGLAHEFGQHQSEPRDCGFIAGPTPQAGAAPAGLADRLLHEKSSATR